MITEISNRPPWLDHQHSFTIGGEILIKGVTHCKNLTLTQLVHFPDRITLKIENEEVTVFASVLLGAIKAMNRKVDQ